MGFHLRQAVLKLALMIKIQSVNFDSSSFLNNLITKKLDKHFTKYDYINEILVFLKLQNNQQEVGRFMEIKILLPHGELFAATKDQDLYKALDKNIDKLKRQLEKYKEKVYCNP